MYDMKSRKLDGLLFLHLIKKWKGSRGFAQDLIELTESFQNKGIHLLSLTENADITTSTEKGN